MSHTYTFDIIRLWCRVKTWAHKLGFELSQLGKYVTNVEKFHESYKQADVTPRDGKSLVREIAKDIKTMMESKISAIKVRFSLYSVCRDFFPFVFLSFFHLAI